MTGPGWGLVLLCLTAAGLMEARRWQRTRRLFSALGMDGTQGAAWRGGLVASAVGLTCAAALIAPAGRDGTGTAAPDRPVLIALDLSRSMLASDGPASRLEEARQAAYRLLAAVEGRSVGLLVFGARPHLMVPPTPDADLVRAWLDAVEPQAAAGTGTDLAAVVLDAAARGAGTLVLLTDAEAYTSDAERLGERGELARAVSAARAAGTRVDAVVVGTPEGGPVPPTGAWSRGDPEGLRRVLGAAGGAVVAPAAAGSLLPPPAHVPAPARDAGGDPSLWLAAVALGFLLTELGVGARAGATA